MLGLHHCEGVAHHYAQMRLEERERSRPFPAPAFGHGLTCLLPQPLSLQPLFPHPSNGHLSASTTSLLGYFGRLHELYLLHILVSLLLLFFYLFAKRSPIPWSRETHYFRLRWLLVLLAEALGGCLTCFM